jgi:hypothetical protein
MKTRIEDFSDNGLFTMSRLGPEKLTHEALEDYLEKGRRLHAAYICGLFVRFWRWLGSLLFQTAGWIGSTLNSRRATLAECIHGFFPGKRRGAHHRRGGKCEKRSGASSHPIAPITGAGVSGTNPDTIGPATDIGVKIIHLDGVIGRRGIAIQLPSSSLAKLIIVGGLTAEKS